MIHGAILRRFAFFHSKCMLVRVFLHASIAIHYFGQQYAGLENAVALYIVWGVAVYLEMYPVRFGNMNYNCSMELLLYFYILGTC